MNFAKVIGQHMADSGLKDILESSGVFGRNTSENIMKGKGWNHVARAHKLALEALWMILWPKFQQWIENSGSVINKRCSELANLVSKHIKSDQIDAARASYGDLVLNIEEIQDLLAEYDKENSSRLTFTYWRQYMELVSILLAFTRALRNGIWSLYISTFKSMMPWFAVYDHTH
jgi:hypothetical protein